MNYHQFFSAVSYISITLVIVFSILSIIYLFVFKFRCEIPIQSYKEESIDSTIESPDVIPADSQSNFLLLIWIFNAVCVLYSLFCLR